MFDLRQLIAHLPPTNKPLRIAARQLHWFRTAFEAHAQLCGELMGCRFQIDDLKLARAFVRWLKNIEQQRPVNKTERREFFEFAPSLMLRELIAEMPLKATKPPQQLVQGSAAEFWPEGYVATTFCLTVYAATMEQEFHTEVEIDKVIDDLRSWWSFRENANEDTSYAAGFFQRVLGNEPNWSMPANFNARYQRNLT
ncbi:hypothetical protein SAMCCGM7_pA0284 (plasmid) [Sinorhizobium americanum CCGM7]|uniref:hypothetical protein n=1 Tax=Sinorhizobium americanum TaxID=194963 RepID=UPI0004D65D74|nr:hypothetical protein [Sinorhizobium americanum]APG86623.1 hypothetical protein SAMCCGM7_pA0284 [Sinorhizobium americanum CCGM7]